MPRCVVTFFMYMPMRLNILYLFLSLCAATAPAQDTLKYQWPVTPFNQTQLITGSFCEYRNTLSSNHFHNGADIPKADGSPVYPCISGTITALSPSSASGTSAYVRVNGTINGVAKSIAYVHIEPNPALKAGDEVTMDITVLGNILTGLGHTHLVDGIVNSENNALRNNGGLTPFVDTYSPKVLWVKFFVDNSTTEFISNRINGYVDIISQMVERNSNDAPNSGSTTNNGVYRNGFIIYSADKSSIVYTPPSDGTRYNFDWKPNDANANVVFTTTSDVSNHIYILTNGSGNIGTTRLNSVYNNYFDTRILPAGQYQLMVFAIDTRGNADTVFVPFEITDQDLAPPTQPVLKSVLNDSTNRITISWYPNTDADLKGYRLYFSTDALAWKLNSDETKLPRSSTKVSFSGIMSTLPIYFRITAVDSAVIPNESNYSDMYGLRPNMQTQKILIVDGFDRTSDSYKLPAHPFAMTAGQSLPIRFETCANDAIIDGSVQLSNYDIVIWNLGDESTTDRTFDEMEQTKVIEYLKRGGKIFVSGSEIAYDLDRASSGGRPTQADRDFLHNYLKAHYTGDASNSYTINGVAGSAFSGISFAYGDVANGSPYPENYPDYIDAVGGSAIVAAYANNLNAMTAFSGTFPNGSTPGASIVLAVPFETIQTKANRDAVMNSVLQYFGVPLSVEQPRSSISNSFELQQNFPNPFNPSTVISYQLPVNSKVSLKIFDLLGREIATVVDEYQYAGSHSVPFSISNYHIASGIYFYQLKAGSFSETRRMAVIK